MILNHTKSADGFYGQGVKIKKSAGQTWAFSPEGVILASMKISTNLKLEDSDKYFGVHCNDYLAFFGVEEILGIRWALCSFTGYSYEGVDENNNIKRGNLINNYFCYILEERIDFDGIDVPRSTMSISDNKLYNNNGGGNEHLGLACIVKKDITTYLLEPEDVLFDSCMQNSRKPISDNKDYFGKEIGAYSILSMVSANNMPIIDVVNNCQYILVIHDGKYKYARKDDVIMSTDSNETIIDIWNNQQGKGIKSNVIVSKETVTLKNEACLMTPEQASNYTGNHDTNLEAKNYTGVKVIGSSLSVCSGEIINGKKFLIAYGGGFLNYYIPYDSISSKGTLSPLQSTIDSFMPTTNITINSNNPTEIATAQSFNSTVNSSSIKNTKFNVSESNESKKISSENSKSAKWYDMTLEAGNYPDNETMMKTGAGYLESKPDNKTPSTWSDPQMFEEMNHYNLNRYIPRYSGNQVGGHADNRQISKINRFKFITDQSGLSTKSFIFMTKPDLNLYALDANNNIIPGSMNPDLKIIPEFKYIGRNKDVGFDILDSLEYQQTGSGNTPWLSIITNQAEGYSPIDREIGYTEVGETFHGHKVLYGKHDFKHNASGTITIPFSERRDLSLYYTLKLWTEYIHAINLGLVGPHPSHIANAELDYAVSLFYIQTDETMENIIYWEKLTGVFPLKCPDSFFEWTKGSNSKSMEHSIEFAYSMRTVLKSSDLYEINALYKKNAIFEYPTDVPSMRETDKAFIYDYYNNPYIAKMATYFGINMTDVKNEHGQRIYEVQGGKTPDSQEFNDFVNNLLSGTDIHKYYYEPFDDSLGNTFYFLPNYLPSIQAHGVPYVKGPFIMPHPDYNGGKFLLKWV